MNNRLGFDLKTCKITSLVFHTALKNDKNQCNNKIFLTKAKTLRSNFQYPALWKIYQKVQIVLGQKISKNWRDPKLQKWHFFVGNFRALCFWHFYDARWHHIMSAWLQKKGFFSPKEKGQWPCLLKTQWYNFESKNMQFKYISRKKIQLLTSC